MCRTSMMTHFNAMCRVSMMTHFNAMCRVSMMTHFSKWWLTSMECADHLANGCAQLADSCVI